MITLRAAIITVLCFIIAVGTRCSCCKCDEVKTQMFYRFQELHVQHVDNTGVDTIASTSNLVDKDAYAMRVDFLCFISGKPNTACSFPSLFINEAKAYQPGCSCENYEMMPVQKIKAIKIEDLEKFDALPAGADVTGRFKFYTGFKSGDSEKRYISPAEYLQSYYPYITTGSFATDAISFMRGVVFFLMEPPATPGSHRFRVTLTLEDNSVVEQTAETVSLQ